MDFSQKLVLVTGGSSGIGLATARAFLGAGARVVILARDRERLEATRKQMLFALPEAQERVFCLSADVSRYPDIFEHLEAMQSIHGTPDILVNSAGVAHPGYVQHLDVEIFHQMMEVNYFGTIHTTQALLPGMITRGSGHIVNLSSLVGVMNIFGYTAYGASKYAIRGYSEALRQEMKPYGIHVSVVYPPDVQTPQLAYENQFKPPETRAISGRGQVLTPESVAQAILRGIRRKKFTILPGFDSQMYYFLVRLFGPVLYPILDYMVAHSTNQESK